MQDKILKDHNVATTSLLANYWKNESRIKENWSLLTQLQGARNQDLFKDSNMQYFINEEVRIEAENRLDKRMWLPLATRTRFFRRTVSTAVKQKEVTQVVILGSGFDTLPVRKAKYTQQFGVRFFEIDQPQILMCKERIYAEENINKNATYIGLDYIKDNLIAALTNNAIDFTQPTLILWEGNTFYLEKEEVIKILGNLSNNFSHLIITFDYMHALMQAETQRLDSEEKEQSIDKTLREFESQKSPFKTFFDFEELISICTELGIQCIDHKTAAELAKEYEVDQEPYYTAQTYSMITFERK